MHSTTWMLWGCWKLGKELCELMGQNISGKSIWKVHGRWNEQLLFNAFHEITKSFHDFMEHKVFSSLPPSIWWCQTRQRKLWRWGTTCWCALSNPMFLFCFAFLTTSLESLSSTNHLNTFSSVALAVVDFLCGTQTLSLFFFSIDFPFGDVFLLWQWLLFSCFAERSVYVYICTTLV